MIGEIYKMWKAEQENQPVEGDIQLATTLYHKEVEKLGIRDNEKKMELWDAVCSYGDSVEAFAFREGFHMAWRILKELEQGQKGAPGGPGPGGGRRPQSKPAPVTAGGGMDAGEPEAAPAGLCMDLGQGAGVQGAPARRERVSGPQMREIAEQAFVTFQANKWGKRLQFNRTAAAMLGDASRVDMHYREGKLYIYPTDDGEFRIVRGNTNGHVQICCSRIIDRIVLDGTRRILEGRDNHFVIRVA